jgi:hypothetical protein
MRGLVWLMRRSRTAWAVSGAGLDVGDTEGGPFGLGAVPIGLGPARLAGQQKKAGSRGTAAFAGSGWWGSAHGIAAGPTQGRLAKPIAPLHGQDPTRCRPVGQRGVSS